MAGGGMRLTRSPDSAIVDRTPLAASRHSIIPNDRKNRFRPASTATAPTNAVASRNHQPSRVGGSLRLMRDDSPGRGEAVEDLGQDAFHLLARARDRI